MSLCPNCAAEVTAENTFCDACGRFLSDEHLPECAMHSGTPAAGICVVCSIPVCEECSEHSEKKFLCRDKGHRGILENWRVLCRPSSEFDAEAILRNVRAAGITAYAFSLHDHATTYWMKEQRVLVFVHTADHVYAQKVLQDLALLAPNGTFAHDPA
jgi:hypothetical protein